MAAYLVRRGLQALVTLWVLLTIAFLLTHLSGDPVVLFLDSEDLQHPEIVAEMRGKLGLDQPLPLQYVRFLRKAVVGDFGKSLRHHGSALSLVLQRLPATAQLAGASLFLAILVSVPAGTFAAVKAIQVQPLYETPIMLGTLIGQSTPSFWLGLMLMLAFGLFLGWLPISGRGGIKHLILPAVALGLRPAAYFTRLTRAALLDVLSQDYVTVARSKGLSEWLVLARHALRNAMIPVITAIGLSFGRLLGGAVVIETVFAWPGLGRFAVQAVFNRDFSVVQAAVFVGGLSFVAINLLMDFVYAYLDPRIRYV
ncbi:MAG: ABC transporter permease [bacterium]